METKLSLKNFTTNQHEPTRTITRIRSKSFWCSLLIILFVNLAASNFLFSQDVNANYFIETEGGEQRIRQRLTWRGGANTYRYEVVIEKNENGSFIPHISEFSSVTFIIVSLVHGNYRFCVIPYDVFDIAGQSSEWRNIEVRHALKPQLSEAQPEIMLDINGDPYGFVVYVSGNNLHPDAEFFLRHPNNSRTILDDVEYGEEGDVRIYVDSTYLEPGEYNIIVKNPGGFEAEIHRTVLNDVIEQIAKSRERKKEIDMHAAQIENENEIFIEPEAVFAAEDEENKNIVPLIDPFRLKPIFFSIKAAYAPIFSLYGMDFVSAVSFSTQIGIEFRIPYDIYIGADFGVNIFSIASEVIINVNLVGEKWMLKDKFAIGLIIGTGVFVQSELQDPVFLNLGISITWRFIKIMALEAGVNYFHTFNQIDAGFVSPWIGIRFII